MPRRALTRRAGRAARLGRNLVLVLLAVVVIAAGVLLAVPQWRAAVLPSGSITYTASAPAAWRAPETAPAAGLPLDDLEATAAPAAKALAARVPALGKGAAAPPGLVLIDPATGKVLVKRSDRALMPASTMKLLTCLVALDALGGDRTFSTSVVSPSKGVVVLRGGGDPLLQDARTTGRASLQQLAATTASALKKQGVTKVALGYDATLFSGASWQRHWTDNYRYSVSPITALTVGSGFRADNGEAEKNPAAAAANAFAKRLKKAGITVTSTKPRAVAADDQVLAAMQSAPVDQLIEHTLRYSDNVAAETLARHVGLAQRRGGGFSGAEAASRASLKKLGVWSAGMVLDDNSGLSRNNRVSPGALARTMKLVLVEDRLRSLLLGLPVAGVSGTLYDRFDDKSERSGRGVVRAKTGSLRDVSALAGYLITADGAPLVFAIVANGVARPLEVRNWMDRTTAGWASCGC